MQYYYACCEVKGDRTAGCWMCGAEWQPMPSVSSPMTSTYTYGPARIEAYGLTDDDIYPAVPAGPTP